VKAGGQAGSNAQDMVAQHYDALEAALVAHFGFTSVRVLSIASSSHDGSGRRLAGASGLWIHFAATGTAAKAMEDDEKLRQGLQRELDKAGAGIVVLEASTPERTVDIVLSSPPAPALEPAEENSVALPIGLIAGAAALLFCVAGAGIMWRSRQAAKATTAAAASKKASIDQDDGEMPAGKVVAVDDGSTKSASDISVEIVAEP